MLLELLGLLLLVTALVLLVPVGVMLLQTLAAVGGSAQAATVEPGAGAPRARVAVLVPAHDEGAGVAAGLATILPQLQAGDRLLVVADNCSDDTAPNAAAAGAEVIERCDPQRRGKGYALDFGIRHLENDPPEIVVMVDADCALHPGSLDRLIRICVREQRPLQALDLMLALPDAGLRTRIAAFAWAVKNHVRPLGALRLGMPCQLMGTGMAFPWALICRAPLATGHLVEDMRLGLDLAAAGTAPRFCPEACVTSWFPSHAQGEAEQHARWEQGHVSVILHEAPRALWRAVRLRRPALAWMVFDLGVPPVTMLVVLLLAQSALAAMLLAFGGSIWPLMMSLLAVSGVAVALTLAWVRFGRNIVSLRDLLSIPGYMLGKLPLYARIVRRRPVAWVRARRDK